LANQLKISKLKEAIIDYIRNTVEIDNNIKFLEYALLYGIEKLDILDITTAYWINHFDELKQKISIHKLPHNIITSILESDDLDIEEEEVFYLIKECVNNNIAKWQREEITKIWRCVRFCLLPIKVMGDAFRDDSIPKELIIDGTLNALKISKNEEMMDPSLTTCRARSNNSLYTVYRGDKLGSGNWAYNNGIDAMCFITDKRIKLIGIGIFGPKKGELMVEITILEKNITIYKVTHKCPQSGLDEPIQVKLAKTIVIMDNIKYEIILKINGNNSYRMCNGLDNVCVEEVNFLFINSEKSSNGTSIASGQIPTLYFKKIIVYGL